MYYITSGTLVFLYNHYLPQVKHQTKITQFTNAVIRDENVLGLDVHVHQIMVVKVFNCLKHYHSLLTLTTYMSEPFIRHLIYK